VLAPDLPGFGYSTRGIDDYGFASHAEYLLQFLDRLGVQRVHLVAYSMGGGAAVHMAAERPERIASLSLISSIGVQELELLGDYHLNHALHGFQLGVLWALQALTPHMGLWDRFALNTHYARNFYDSDQRPLRGLMAHIDQPVLIIHGQNDRLVPMAAAREHHRLIPQSTLETVTGGHLMLFRQTAAVADRVTRHIKDTVDGRSPTRAGADASRKQAAQDPFGDIQLPPATGVQLICYAVMIALATLISEDLACIGAGMMAARGIIGYLPATMAAFAGIVAGDLLLYAAGRIIGRGAVRRAPLRWFLKPEDVARASQWFTHKGAGIILTSRFLPGSRLPVYFTAGVLGGRVWSFLFYFCIAAAIWTPGLVGMAMLAGAKILTYYGAFHQYALWVALSTMLALWVVVRLSVPLLSYKGRRLLLSRYKRLRHWEFWPLGLFYAPVVAYILHLGLRYRHWTLFTAANPGIPGGGIVGESKSDILSKLTASNAVAPFTCIHRDWPSERQLQQVRWFMEQQKINFPVVCKPDVGERGKGVRTVHCFEALQDVLQSAEDNTIVQQYVAGEEFGVFYFRFPGSEKGRIFGITEKRLLSVTGDGRDTLERLILKHPRAVCMAPLHLKVHEHRLHHIPLRGEEVQLVEVGTHCRGAVFLDGGRFATAALARSFDTISRHFKGFYFGRYDVRTNDRAAFKSGQGFKILELNGVTSEATHIYDPSFTLIRAWGTLMRQWRIAFEIGKLNCGRGASDLTTRQFFALVLSNRNGSGARKNKKNGR